MNETKETGEQDEGKRKPRLKLLKLVNTAYQGAEKNEEVGSGEHRNLRTPVDCQSQNMCVPASELADPVNGQDPFALII